MPLHSNISNASCLDRRSPFSRKWSGYPMRRSSLSRHPLARKFGWPSWQWRLELAAQLQRLSCQNVEVEEEQRNSNGSDETELKEENVISWYLVKSTDQGSPDVLIGNKRKYVHDTETCREWPTSLGFWTKASLDVPEMLYVCFHGTVVLL